MSALGWSFDSLFQRPRPCLKNNTPQYPEWNLPERKEPEKGYYRMSAPDFNVPPGPSVKAAKFRQYDEDLTYKVILNDGCKQSLMWLTMARNIFNQELGQMPEHYISRLVFNENHCTVLLMHNGVVLGGITLRPFPESGFAEIAFCAVSSAKQISGFGSHVMAHVKTYLQTVGIHDILTYADNTAVGYFKRQGFTREININPQLWQRCIKDYTDATLIHCKIRPDIDYLRINDVVDQQKRLVSSLMKDYEIVKLTKWPTKRIQGIDIEDEPEINVRGQMLLILEKLRLHSRAWPFLVPVSKKEAEGYDKIVKHPMDLSTLEKNINKGEYPTFQRFEEDVRLIFSNCYAYNSEESVYWKCAQQLEVYFNSILPEFQTGRPG